MTFLKRCQIDRRFSCIDLQRITDRTAGPCHPTPAGVFPEKRPRGKKRREFVDDVEDHKSAGILCSPTKGPAAASWAF